MFEDRTAENILEEMLSGITDVNTSEGSLMYEACAQQAMALEQAYLDLRRLYDNLSIDNMEEEFFEVFAQDRGVYRIDATSPVVLCEVGQELELGTRFSVDTYDYEVTTLQDHNDQYHYLARCETAGTEANNTVGEMQPIDYIENWNGGKVVSIVTYGKPQETLDAYKARFKEERYQIKPFAGNKAAYREYVKEYNKTNGTVADCIPMRTKDKKTTELWVVDPEFKALSKAVLEDLQNQICPVPGEGEGMAPIWHDVKVRTPENVVIDVSVVVTLDTEYTWDGVKDSIKEKIDKYLLAVRTLWSKNQKCVVRLSQVEYAVLSVQGVLDCTGAMINGVASNLNFEYSKVPVMGGVSNGE